MPIGSPEVSNNPITSRGCGAYTIQDYSPRSDNRQAFGAELGQPRRAPDQVTQELAYVLVQPGRDGAPPAVLRLISLAQLE
jgi:hypothetical protein